MKRLIRKYDDFLKSKMNEDIDPMITPDSIESDDEFERTEDLEDMDSSNILDSEEDVSGAEEEEESGQYHGTVLMKELANMLGVEINNNEIEYNGQTINFYSETEKFHVGKNKFDTPEEVVEYLKGTEEVVESRRFNRKPRHKH